MGYRQSQIRLKSEAEALRLGLIAGLVERQSAVKWADAMILSGAARDAPAVLDVSLAGGRPVAQLVSLLGEIPGEIDPTAVGRRLARDLATGLASGHLEIVQVARAMYRITHEGYAPDREFESEAYSADDGVDLARSGTYGTLEEVHREVQTFLDRYLTPSAAGSTSLRRDVESEPG